MSTQMFTPAETIIESNEQFDANNIHVTQIDNVPDKYDLELCVDWIKTRGLERVNISNTILFFIIFFNYYNIPLSTTDNKINLTFFCQLQNLTNLKK